MSTIAIEALTADDIRTTALRELCELVRDAVSGGASVGWVTVPSEREASDYWRGVADQVQRGAVVVLVARAPSTVVGTVQLHRLYEKLGYRLAGMIPTYARGTTGTLEPTSIMYKDITDAGDHAT
jgi:hypothetical protein